MLWQRFMYDVIVVGAGPAGSSCAHHCAKRGLKTILLDYRKRPGTPKQCAEGINKEILKEIGIKLKPEWISQEIHSMVVSDFTHFAKLEGKRTQGYILERKEFDYGLVMCAKKAGATLQFGSRVVDVQKNKVILETGKEIEGKVVVGADGPQSTVGKKTGLGNPKLGFALQYEIETTKNDSRNSLQTYLDPSLEDEGYLWIFPKKETLNVGLGSMHIKNLKIPLDKFVKKLGLENEKILETNAGFIPLHGPVEKFYGKNVVLIGDAAGHTNPLTGGGIPVAIFDGHLVSDIIKDHITKGTSLAKYQTLWWRSNFGKATKVSLKVRKVYLDMLKNGRLSECVRQAGNVHITSLRELAQLGRKVGTFSEKVRLFFVFRKFMKYLKYGW